MGSRAHAVDTTPCERNKGCRHAPSDSPTTGAVVRLTVAVVLTGVGAGVGGMVLALLLHAIQHVAYGYSLHELNGPESFLQGVSAASPLRRVGVLAVCGVVAGCGWSLLYRFARPLVSIETAIAAEDPRMPLWTTTAEALLQIVTVALGSPLGREVAPREIGAMFAGWVSRCAGLTLDESRVMVACGAGAGLAAVYNAPLGGAVFVLEVLLSTLQLQVVLPALATSAIAVVVAWSGLGNAALYTVSPSPPSATLIVWSSVMGPLFGTAAFWFKALAARARASARRNWQLPVLSLFNFTIIGLLAIKFPELLGNGRAPAQLGFASELSIGLALALLVLKVAITASSLRAGAGGGLLTPSLSNGALLAIVLGGLWSIVWPGPSLGTFAIVGAAAFLASSMSMPVTAIVLLVEFTGMDQNVLVPILLAVAGSVAAERLCAHLYRPHYEVPAATTCAVPRCPRQN